MKASLHNERAARRGRWLEGGLIFAFWTMLAVLMVGSRVLDARHGTPDAGFVAYLFVESYVWALLTPLIFWISSRFSLERANWHALVPLHAGLAVLVSVVVEMLNDLSARYVTRPPWADRVTLDPLASLLELGFLNDLLIYLAVLATGFARDYFLRYRERQEEATKLQAQAARLQAQLAEARLEALRMQINPHFLFNTLHAISSLTGRDPKGVRRMIARLSELLRYALESSSTQEVPLKQELQFLEGYLEIQRIRFQGRLETSVEAAPGILEALVPSLILQPLVENAIKHGAGKVEGRGYVAVHARHEDGRLILSVRDNGPGLHPGDGAQALRQGVGLRNTRERLQTLYGGTQDLTLEPADDGGLLAQITLPYHTAADVYASAASPLPA